MARLGGLSSEAFSPPAGLGSILRDQKVLPGVRSNRANAVLNMIRPPVPQSVSLSSSPKDSFLLDVGTADESDDLKEEDIWGMDDATDDGSPGTYFEQHRASTVDELSLGIGSSRNNYTDKVTPPKRRESFVSSGAMGSSLLSRTPKTSPLSGRPRIPRRLSASQMIPLSGGSGKEPARRHAEGQSAPVEVPKWSKMIARRNAKVGVLYDEDLDAKDDDDDRLPPHELLAQENARSQRSTFSVCEGVGRTLKGRDLSRVRNAVWSQMGFAD